jgi:lysyl-tRNA synthetase class I
VKNHSDTVFRRRVLALASCGAAPLYVEEEAGGASAWADRARERLLEVDLGRDGSSPIRSLQIRNEVATAWHQLGLAFEGLGRVEDAREAYKRSVEIQGEVVEHAPEVLLYAYGFERAEASLAGLDGE